MRAGGCRAAPEAPFDWVVMPVFSGEQRVRRGCREQTADCSRQSRDRSHSSLRRRRWPPRCASSSSPPWRPRRRRSGGAAARTSRRRHPLHLRRPTASAAPPVARGGWQTTGVCSLAVLDALEGNLTRQRDEPDPLLPRGGAVAARRLRAHAEGGVEEAAQALARRQQAVQQVGAHPRGGRRAARRGGGRPEAEAQARREGAAADRAEGERAAQEGGRRAERPSRTSRRRAARR